MKNGPVRIARWLTETGRGTPLSLGLLVLRVGFGGMMLFGHGWGKLVGFGEKAAMFPDLLGIGGPANLALVVFAEFFCSIALILGLATRLAAVPLIVTMAVAVFVVHANDPWHGKEMAVMYLVPFLTLFVTGGGRLSLDAMLWDRKRLEAN